MSSASPNSSVIDGSSLSIENVSSLVSLRDKTNTSLLIAFQCISVFIKLLNSNVYFPRQLPVSVFNRN